MAKKNIKKPTDIVIVPHGTTTRIAEDLGICRETVSNALRCKNTSFASFIIQQIAKIFYNGK